jgi:hypothetical protein
MSDIGDVFDQATDAFEIQKTVDEKPLFIPLRTQWFREFEAGTKDTEYRAYGPRWNERTCRIGRKATVSHGYSGKRLERVVASFEMMSWSHAPKVAQDIYPYADFIAAIHLPNTTVAISPPEVDSIQAAIDADNGGKP